MITQLIQHYSKVSFRYAVDLFATCPYVTDCQLSSCHWIDHELGPLCLIHA